MSWRAVNDEAPYRKVSKQSEGLEGFLRGDTVKVEASQDPGAKKRGVRSHRKDPQFVVWLSNTLKALFNNRRTGTVRVGIYSVTRTSTGLKQG